MLGLLACPPQGRAHWHARCNPCAQCRICRVLEQFVVKLGSKSPGRPAEAAEAGASSGPASDAPFARIDMAAPAIVVANTILGAGCSLEGKLVCSGPARIGGAFSGEIHGDDVVIIEDGATVVADLRVDALVVIGRVRGNISAARRVSLAATADIEGDIETPSLTIEEGAQVRGKIHVAPRGEVATPAPAPVSADPAFADIF